MATRGKSKQKNWRLKPGDPLAVIGLQLDVSGLPEVRERIRDHFWAAYSLHRALVRSSIRGCRGYWRMGRLRDAEGPAAAMAAAGIDRDGIERQAKVHLDRSGWLHHHLTKATGLHLASAEQTAIRRHLFKDAAGRRSRAPKLGPADEFTRIPGRARSHTKERTWETYRLIGSLQGHLDAYGGGASVEDALAADPGTTIFRQPRHLPAPEAPGTLNGRPDWWSYDGPLAVLYTNGSRSWAAPVRLPSGAGELPRLAHFLADREDWHKMDLVRIRDGRAAGGWRYETRLTVTKTGWASPAVLEARARIPRDRVAGVDPNVGNVTVASFEPRGASLRVTAISPSVAAESRAKKAADRVRRANKRMDASRRAANPEQYELSKAQQARADRREQEGLAPIAVEVPKGPRATRADGRCRQRHRKDRLSRAHRREAERVRRISAAERLERDRMARAIAREVVAEHGVDLNVEQNSIAEWSRRWGKRTSVTTPGRMVAALEAEARACGGTVRRVSAWTTAASQTCLCGAKAKKALGERVHDCPGCGLHAGRDALSAMLMRCVADDEDRLDPAKMELLADTVRRARQEEGAVGSTVFYAELSGSAEGGPTGPAATPAPARQDSGQQPTTPGAEAPGTRGDAEPEAGLGQRSP